MISSDVVEAVLALKVEDETDVGYSYNPWQRQVQCSLSTLCKTKFTTIEVMLIVQMNCKQLVSVIEYRTTDPEIWFEGTKLVP
jgi:hypothetical protein